MKPFGLCVFVTVRNDYARWIDAIYSSWANRLTYYVTPPLQEKDHVSLRNSSVSESLRGRHLQLARIALGVESGFELWTAIARELKKVNTSSSVLENLQMCDAMLHVNANLFVNLERLVKRLKCLAELNPMFYALSPQRVGQHLLANENFGGYIIGRRLLQQFDVRELRRKCESNHPGDINLDVYESPGQRFVSCLELVYSLTPRRIGDPRYEVLLDQLLTKDTSQVVTPSRRTGITLLRGLHPMGHCALIVHCRSAHMMKDAHRIMNQDVELQKSGCYETHLERPDLDVRPEWHPLVLKRLQECPLRHALLRESSGKIAFATLLAALRAPAQPKGAAAKRLKRRGRRKELCIFVGVSDAPALQVERAKAVVETWLQSHLGLRLRVVERTIGVLYSRRPLLEQWKNITLSLVGDLDLRHPKFNAHRFLYLWATLAWHHRDDCDFYLKADPDTYVNVFAVSELLRAFNASVPLYLGKVAMAHIRHGGGANTGDDGWEPFSHGLGYILSRGALRVAKNALRGCMEYFARHYLESQEDMTLAACLKAALIEPQDVDPVVYSFDGDIGKLLAKDETPLFVHPVGPVDMAKLHAAMQEKMRSGQLREKSEA
eukprot:TRINITY_DN32801_c0_g1_i1.p1 TRINITY_DN32801_c0_g1~~TRINITY_DN32801_c0_g1_i1.p1  ORF type:complete len:606 (+),score=76.53 TRINITY_DN32801_c0_g1_i1:98-1915(+)